MVILSLLLSEILSNRYFANIRKEIHGSCPEKTVMNELPINWTYPEI